MDLIPAVLVILLALATGLFWGWAAQRLLGLRLGFVRMLVTGGFALVVAPPIALGTAALFGLTPDRLRGLDAPGITVLYALTTVIVTLLASMIFIVVIEAFAPLGSIPPATVWGRGLVGRVRRARRYAQIVVIALRHGLGRYLRGRGDKSLDAASGRTQFGRALAATLNAGGVTFTKIGQILATRRDLLPAEVIAELGRLQDDAPPVPWEDLEGVLADELAAPVDEVFASIDPTPLGAASIGQVHAARLHSGADVVVKVQRPGIRATVERDLDIAGRLAARLEASTTWAARMRLGALADGLATAIREELDHRIEADNMLAVARAHPAESQVRVPRVHRDLSSERVLVMERFFGAPLHDAATLIDEHDLDRVEIARRLLACLFHQIVDSGIFHADPHAGNVVVFSDGQLGLLDFGSVGRIDAGLRDALQRLLLGVDHGDPLEVSDALLELVARPDVVDHELLERDLGRFMARHVSGAACPSARMFADLLRIVADHGLAIPGEVAAVFRALATTEGTLTAVAPDFNLVDETRRLAGDHLARQFTAANLQDAAVKEMATLLPIMRRLPRRIDRIANAAEHGRLSVNLRHFADPDDRAFVTTVVQEVLVAFLAATIGIIAALLLGTPDGGPQVTESITFHQLLAYNLLAVSAILGLRVLVRIFRRS